MSAPMIAAPVLTMPEPLQAIFLWLTGIAALATLAWSMRIASQQRSARPVLMVAAAFCAIALEPLCTFFGHAVHAEIGTVTFFIAAERTIPWSIAFGYTAAFGLVFLTLYLRATNGRLTRSFVFGTAATTASAYYLFEIVGVSGGMWAYFEPQPLWIWHMTAPPTWSFMNATAEIFTASLIIFLLPRLDNWRQVAIVPLGPIGALMGHFGAGWPMYNMMNSAAPRWAIELSGAATIASALFIWWISAELAIARMPVRTGIPPRKSDNKA